MLIEFEAKHTMVFDLQVETFEEVEPIVQDGT